MIAKIIWFIICILTYHCFVLSFYTLFFITIQHYMIQWKKRFVCKDIFLLPSLQVCQYQSALKPLLVELQMIGSTQQCPTSLRKFLRSLAMDSPVCALVPPEKDVLGLLAEMSKGVDPRAKPAEHMRLVCFFICFFRDFFCCSCHENHILSVQQVVIIKCYFQCILIMCFWLLLSSANS